MGCQASHMVPFLLPCSYFIEKVITSKTKKKKSTGKNAASVCPGNKIPPPDLGQYNRGRCNHVFGRCKSEQANSIEAGQFHSSKAAIHTKKSWRRTSVMGHKVLLNAVTEITAVLLLRVLIFTVSDLLDQNTSYGDSGLCTHMDCLITLSLVIVGLGPPTKVACIVPLLSCSSSPGCSSSAWVGNTGACGVRRAIPQASAALRTPGTSWTRRYQRSRSGS